MQDYNHRMPLSKRILDLLVAAVAILLLSPLIAAVAVLVRMLLGTPILFRQVRPGRGRRPFVLYKFRTMAALAHNEPYEASDEIRLTGLGRWLRSFSIDELPQLVNVLRGDMSLVGPRPLLMEYLPLYSKEQARRHDVTPGLTGWAQIHGRNAADWPTRLALDVWYVDHWSFGLDLKILWRTVWKTLRREGVSQPGSATVERFRGNSL
jgi:sugar transferase EpsL